MRHGGGFAAAVLVIMFSEQAFLNAGPLIARGLQGAAAAGFIFNVLMIARAPLQLFQAVSTSILPHLTSLHTSTEPEQRARVPPHGADGPARRSPPSPRSPSLVVADRRPEADADRLQQEVHLRPRRAAAGHGRDGPLPLLGDAQPGLRRPGPGAARRGPLDRLRGLLHRLELRARWSATSSAGSRSASRSPPALLFGLLYFVYRSPHERAEDVPEAGSPEELEARLAAVDENV